MRDDRLCGVEGKLEKPEYDGESPLVCIDVNMLKEENNPTSVYECRLCKMTYTSKAGLEKHLTHVHFRKVKCSECDAEVPKKCYRLHLKNEHGLLLPETVGNDENENKKDKSGEGPSNDNAVLCYPGVVCTVCNQIYSNDLNLKKHMYNVHRMIRVKCNVCDKEVNKKSLVRHMKNVHSAEMSFKGKIPEDEKFPCTYCGKKCCSSISLLNHVRALHEAEQYKCSKCEFQGTKKHLERHMRRKHNDEVYQCGSCQKILKSKSTLKEHMWIHSDQRRYICAVCGLQFKRTSNYHGHMKSHQNKKFQCRICGNFFLRKRYLAIHEQTIHNFYGEGVPPQEKRYQCEICGVKLKWKNNLLAHMRIHTGEKPYKCKICGEEFTCHGSLRTHMIKHCKYILKLMAHVLRQYMNGFMTFSAVCPTGLDDSNALIQQAYLGQQKERTSGLITSTVKNG